MKTKAFPAHIKAAGEPDGLAPGQFEAIVSVFSVRDFIGDVVMPGAFSRSLADWKDRGDPIPVIWSHQIGDPESHIGFVLDAAELLAGDDRLPAKLRDKGGLWVRAQLDMDEVKAAKVHRLLKGRRVTQFSFTYDIEKSAPIEWEGQDSCGLYDLTIHEVGPTLLGMNASTDLVAAKDRPCPACGRDDSKAKPAPAATDADPTPVPPASAATVKPNLSPADVLLSLQVDALAYGLDI